MAIRSYRDLRVWQEGMNLMVAAYQIARRLPKEETYGLAAQMRRAAVSVPANIAEGHGREHLGDYLRHLSIANGSLKELETEIMATGRLEYITTGDLAPALTLSANVGRMLAGLKQSLGKKFRRHRRPPVTDDRSPKAETRIGHYKP